MRPSNDQPGKPRKSGRSKRDAEPAHAPPASRAMAQSEQMFRLLVESVTDYSVLMLDPQGHIVTWNPGAEQRKGFTKGDVLGQHFSMFFTPEALVAGRAVQELAGAARDGRFETQDWRLRKDGSRFWAHVILTAIHGPEGELRGFAKVTRDMTAQKELEDAQAQLALDLDHRVRERTIQLEASVAELKAKNDEIESLAAMVSHDLREKEVLLREVYHRVKNNLQVVQSLLKMGARLLRSDDGRQAIETAVQRVYVMAMVHEHLYQMPDLSGLTLATYLRDVVEGAIAANSEQPDQVQVQLESDEIPVPLDFAIPIGLLANELVSNCLKHGLPHGRRGRITISARRIPGAVRLVVHDDGAGLPEGFDAAKCTSMGLKLAASLAHQLGGRLEFTSCSGCRVQADLTRLSSENDGLKPSGPPMQFAPSSLIGASRKKAAAETSLTHEFTDPNHCSH
jgi:PAS domain S-box-containing protein